MGTLEQLPLLSLSLSVSVSPATGEEQLARAAQARLPPAVRVGQLEDKRGFPSARGGVR